MIYKLAVIGKPIAHSLSPMVFKLFANRDKTNINYTKILADDEHDFASKVKQFFKDGGYALNITSPFKQAAFKLATSATKRANISSASNLLRLDDNGDIIADTTDGRGLIQDITTNLATSLFGKNVLILGSGYAVDSIIPDIWQAKVNSIAILARNKLKVKYLMNKFKVVEYNPDMCYDIIINTSPNINDNQLFKHKFNLSEMALAYDLSYHNHLSDMAFFQMLKRNDITTARGLGMLIEQAKLTYFDLFKRLPQTTTELIVKDLNSLGYYV